MLIFCIFWSVKSRLTTLLLIRNANTVGAGKLDLGRAWTWLIVREYDIYIVHLAGNPEIAT